MAMEIERVTIVKGKIIDINDQQKNENIDINNYLYTWYGDKDIYMDAQEIAYKLYSQR